MPARLPGGWVPPEMAPPEMALPEQLLVEQSWAPRPTEDAPHLEDSPHPEQTAGPLQPAGILAGFVPTGLRGGRWDPGARGLPVLAVVALVAALVAGFVLVRGRPHEVTAPPLAVASSAPEAGGFVVVDVAGKVRRPGIVRLPLGSRVDDAVRAAGGPLPGATYDGLNRARKLTDGEQVLVGVRPVSGAAGSAPATDARVDLNAADVTALDALPGIGPVLAQKIVDWRTEHGRFASVDQLREVSGIGESKFAALKNKVRT